VKPLQLGAAGARAHMTVVADRQTFR